MAQRIIDLRPGHTHPPANKNRNTYDTQQTKRWATQRPPELRRSLAFAKCRLRQMGYFLAATKSRSNSGHFFGRRPKPRQISGVGLHLSPMYTRSNDATPAIGAHMFLRICPGLILALSSCLASAQSSQPFSIVENIDNAKLDESSLPAQLPSQASTYTLRGTVVNSVTGEAIAGALVQINSGVQRSLLTGANGKFVFDGMPEGQTNILTRKPGFFAPDSIPSSIPKPQPLVIVTADMPSILLKLI